MSLLTASAAPRALTWRFALREMRGGLSGFLIFLTVLSISLVGNGLRDALDPRLND